MKIAACLELMAAVVGKQCEFVLQAQVVVISDSDPQHNDAWDSPVSRLIDDIGKSASPPSRGKIKHLGK